MDGKTFEELVFTSSCDLRRGLGESGDQVLPSLPHVNTIQNLTFETFQYSNFGELVTPNPSPTSPSFPPFPSWNNFSAGSAPLADFQSYFPDRIMTNQGNEMARMGNSGKLPEPSVSRKSLRLHVLTARQQLYPDASHQRSRRRWSRSSRSSIGEDGSHREAKTEVQFLRVLQEQRRGRIDLPEPHLKGT